MPVWHDKFWAICLSQSALQAVLGWPEKTGMAMHHGGVGGVGQVLTCYILV